MSGEHSVWWPTWEKYMHFLEWFTTLPLWAFPHQWIPHIFKPIARFCTPGSVKSQAHSHCLLLIVYHSEEGKQDLPQYEQCGFFCLFSFWGLHPSSPLRLSCCAASAQNLRVYEVVVEVLACPGTNHILSPYGNYQSWFWINPLWRRSLACRLLWKMHEEPRVETQESPAAISVKSKIWYYIAWSN